MNIKNITGALFINFIMADFLYTQF
jgi:hypothetical protein